MGNSCTAQAPPITEEVVVMREIATSESELSHKKATLDNVMADSAVVEFQPAVHMLVCALDYKKTACPLTCTMDGNNMLDLARHCNAKTTKALYDEEATRPNVVKSIKEVGSKCKPGDYFIFFYAGHGSSLKDNDGDEEDGIDECFCLVDKHGQTSKKDWLRDDDFAKAVSSSVSRGTNIVVISDCCHSGTVADLGRPEWRGHRAISISGCTDKQTSGDTGSGGIFTHALLLAIQKLNKKGLRKYSLQDLYVTTLAKDDKIFRSPQDITLHTVPGFSSDGMEWPLVPPESYKAPYRTTLQQFADALHMPVLLGSKDNGTAAAPEVVQQKSCFVCAHLLRGRPDPSLKN